MRFTSRCIPVLLLCFTLASMILTTVVLQAQDVTPEAIPQPTVAASSAAQLVLRRPLLGMHLMETGDAPTFYQGLTLGGGDLYVSIGAPCIAGYTNALAALGMVWIEASGPVQVGFTASDPALTTAILLWDELNARWWCNQEFSAGNSVQFSTLEQGIYFVWVLTQTDQAAQGTVFVRAMPSS